MVNVSALERAAKKIAGFLRHCKWSISASLTAGLLAYMYVFTNKLLNLDEIAGLFTKGSTISSGRWALWLSSLVFPDASMPWINGILSLLMLSLAACLIISLFEIRSVAVQMLLSALFVVFPSQIVTFSYMFTAPPYALALLLAVASVYLTFRGGKLAVAVGCLFLALSLGIYQAYIAMAAALYVVYLIKLLLDGADCAAVVKKGFASLAALLFGLLLYALINKLVMTLSGTAYNDYAGASFQTDLPSILSGLRVAYTAFLGYFYRGYYYLVPTDFSKLLHILCLVVTGAVLLLHVLRLFKEGQKGRAGLILAMLVLLPLAVNCLYVASAQRHTLMLHSFTAVYVLAALALEKLFTGRAVKLRGLVSISLALILCCNILFANKLYLKMKLEYENAYSFYNGLVTRIKACPGFDGESMVVISGDAENQRYSNEEINTSDIVGLMEGLINIYSRNDFMTYYTGFCPPPTDWTAWEEAGASKVLETMPEYPADGSVQKAGDYILVKLG